MPQNKSPAASVGTQGAPVTDIAGSEIDREAKSAARASQASRTKFVQVPNYRTGLVEWREVPADPAAVVQR
jgi:hypothetical protein